MDNQQDIKAFSQMHNIKYSEFKVDDLRNSEPEDLQTIDLAWLLGVLRRRSWIMAVAVCILSGISGSMIVWNSKKIVSSYTGSIKILVEPVTAEGRLARISLLAESGGRNTGATEIAGKIGIDRTDLVDYETMIRVLTSPKLMLPLVEELQTQYPKISYLTLRSNLELTRISYKKDGQERGTKILRVIYEDADTKKIKFVLEKVAETYLQYSLEERLNTLGQGIKFIDEQLPNLQGRVDSLQKELQKLRQQYNINYPEINAEKLSAQAQDLKTERVRIEADLEAQRSFYASMQQAIQSGRVKGIISRQPTIYQDILSQLHRVEAEIAIKSVQLRENSLPMQILREKQRNLFKILVKLAENDLQAVAIQIQELETRAKYISQVENKLDQKIEVFPEVLRQYSEIERNLAVATETLKTFLRKREALMLNASQKEYPWQIISPPQLSLSEQGQLIPTSQKSTKKNLAIAVILSTLLGIGIGLIVEVLDTVFHSPEEVKAATKLRLIGVIPWAKKIKYMERQRKKFARKSSKELDLSHWPQPEFSASFLEAFRSLYTNISLLGSKNRPIRSLVVGSAASKDGKSTIAMQLAQTAATIGQRVLLVDADMRHPQLHQRLGLQNQRGLSDTIGNYLSLNEVIQRSPIEENLFFLSAGQVSPDPIKLISSQKMEYLMGQLQGFFDLVIYNTPPLVGLADGNLIAARADGIILVVGLEKTDRSLVKKALEELKTSGAAILGFVANHVKG